MAHFPPMPGQPLHDGRRGVAALLDAVARDVEILGERGVDAVMFCMEGDRPYRTQVGPEVPAVMAAVITEVKRTLRVPFGVDILWDPRSAIGLADAVCVSGVVTGEGVDVSHLRGAKEAVGDGIAVIANTGVRPETVGQMLAVADGCIVGTSLKREGNTWNPVDRERVERLVDAAAASGVWEPARPLTAAGGA